MIFFVFCATLSPNLEKIVIDGNCNVNCEVFKEIFEIGVRDKQIIIDITQEKQLKEQQRWKIDIEYND